MRPQSPRKELLRDGADSNQDTPELSARQRRGNITFGARPSAGLQVLVGGIYVEDSWVFHGLLVVQSSTGAVPVLGRKKSTGEIVRSPRGSKPEGDVKWNDDALEYFGYLRMPLEGKTTWAKVFVALDAQNKLLLWFDNGSPSKKLLGSVALSQQLTFVTEQSPVHSFSLKQVDGTVAASFQAETQMHFQSWKKTISAKLRTSKCSSAGGTDLEKTHANVLVDVPLTLDIYGVKMAGCVHAGTVVFECERLMELCGVSSASAAGWIVPDVKREGIYCTRVGLLRIIAHGTTPKALELLTQIAHKMGLDSQEETVRNAEENIAAARERFKEEERKRVEEEFARWEQEMAEKKRARAVSRAERRQSVREAARSSIIMEEKQSKRRSTVLEMDKQRRHRESLHGLDDQRAQLALMQIMETPAAEDLHVDDTRVVKHVQPPSTHVVTLDELFIKGKVPDVALLTKHLLRRGKIHKSAALKLIRDTAAILEEEPNLIRASADVLILGDIHGQFYDLIAQLKNADLTQTSLLCLGDYVDRGAFGMEVVFLLYALKLRDPKRVHLLRGNHETRSMASFYNFKSECMHKFDLEVYEAVQDSFDRLPLACMVESGHGRYFCCHGGLSPFIRFASDVDRLERVNEPPEEGPVCDMLWSDPLESWEDPGEEEQYYVPNSSRGCGQFFGRSAVLDFLENNELVCMIRAHEVQPSGFLEHRFRDANRPVPLCITLFSAPNYLGTYENQAARLHITNPRIQVMRSGWVDFVPFALQDGRNIVATTLPSIGEALASLFVSALERIVSNVDGEPEDDVDASMRAKVRNLGRAIAALRVKRKEMVGSLAPALVEAKTSMEMFSKSDRANRVSEANPRFRSQ